MARSLRNWLLLLIILNSFESSISFLGVSKESGENWTIEHLI